MKEYEKDGNLYKGVLAFMLVGFKLSILFVVQTIAEVTFSVSDSGWPRHLLTT